MVTLTIILLLILVPPARRILLRMLSSVLGALGLMFLVAREPRSPRKF